MIEYKLRDYIQIAWKPNMSCSNITELEQTSIPFHLLLFPSGHESKLIF